MKGKLLAIILCVAIIVSVIVLNQKNNAATDCIRIHIRANSNSENDQNVKLDLRDAIVCYLTPILSTAENKKQARALLKKELENLEKLGEAHLREINADYTMHCCMQKEEFPLRKYGDLVFESGEYEALIITLGEGKGDNWWCVAYPPLCFVPEGEGEIVYKSKILEVIKSYKEKHCL